MRILLDENVPLALRQFFPSHDVTTVQALGWSGASNGELIRRADGAFDVLILADKNLRYQQNLANRKLALVELPTNRWPNLQLIIPRIVAAVETSQPGSYSVVNE